MHADSLEHLEREMKRTLDLATSSPSSPVESKSSPRITFKRTVGVKQQRNEQHHYLSHVPNHSNKNDERTSNDDNNNIESTMNKDKEQKHKKKKKKKNKNNNKMIIEESNNKSNMCLNNTEAIENERVAEELTITQQSNASQAEVPDYSEIQTFSVSSSAAWVHPLDVKLHDILLCLTPTEQQQQHWLRVLCDVQRALHPIGLTIAIYGSLRTGLLTPSSDIDCVMMPCEDPDGMHQALTSSELYHSCSQHLPNRFQRYSKYHGNSNHYEQEQQQRRWGEHWYENEEDSYDSEECEQWYHHQQSKRNSHYKDKSSSSTNNKMPYAISRAVQSSSGLTENGFSTRERQGACACGIRVVANAIRSSRLFRNVFTIAHARVPIVKCVHNNNNNNNNNNNKNNSNYNYYNHKSQEVKIDLSFERDGCMTSLFLCEEFARPGNELARALIILVKALVSEWHLDDPSCGGLGSFPISLMVLWYLRHEVPRCVPEELRQSIGVLLSGFLYYYGNTFNFTRSGIDYVKQCTFNKPAAAELYIVNPIRPGTNCAKAATVFASKVIPQFKSAAQTFMRLLNHHTGSENAHDSASNNVNNISSKNIDDHKTIETTLNNCFRSVLPAGQQWVRVVEMAEHTRQRYYRRQRYLISNNNNNSNNHNYDNKIKNNSDKNNINNNNNNFPLCSLQHSWDA